VINTNKITSETKTSDKTEISQKLDSKLEYILNNEIQNVGNAQKDIEKAEETLSRTLGSDNIDARDALGALTALAESKSKIISLKSELDKLKSQDLSEEEFNNLISGITNQVDIALKSAPLEVKIIDSSSYQEFTNDEKTTSTISSYLAEYYPDLSDRELKSKLDEAKKLQDKLVVNVKLIKRRNQI
jgi:predicted nucleic acid-binding protein